MKNVLRGSLWRVTREMSAVPKPSAVPLWYRHSDNKDAPARSPYLSCGLSIIVGDTVRGSNVLDPRVNNEIDVRHEIELNKHADFVEVLFPVKFYVNRVLFNADSSHLKRVV